jgi:hypothetical protein
VNGREEIEDISNGGINPTTIEMSKSKLEELSWIEDNIGIYNNRNGLRFYQDTTPERFDVVNSYSVLDNPLLSEVANAINEAAKEYGIDNHFYRINAAAKLVQSNEYKGRIGVNRTEEAEGVSIPTPETYWMSEKSENCVGHTFQLSWLLYHLGYTCGAVHFRLEDPPNHQGVAMPVPEEVLREEFDGPLERYQIIDADGKRFINETIDFSYSNPPESLGDYPWIYIEPTGEWRIGRMPFSERWVRDPKVMLAIEPDDNKFNTNILGN